MLAKDADLVSTLVTLWYAERAWAEDFLKRHLGLANAQDIMSKDNRGKHRIGNTNWYYQTHGVGVDVCRLDDCGGIDFDFDKPDPDPWRLAIFFERQYRSGALDLHSYQEFYENEDRFKEAAVKYLSS